MEHLCVSTECVNFIKNLLSLDKNEWVDFMENILENKPNNICWAELLGFRVLGDCPEKGEILEKIQRLSFNPAFLNMVQKKRDELGEKENNYWESIEDKEMNLKW